MREFDTGANRDSDEGKLPFARALSPRVLKRYTAYMLKHNTTEDGTRAPDNWKAGIPTGAYMDSMFRHFFEVWEKHHDKEGMSEQMQEALCALLFNVMGYLDVNLEANNDVVLKLGRQSIQGHIEQIAADYAHVAGITITGDGSGQSYSSPHCAPATMAQQVADNAKRKHHKEVKREEA